MFIFALSRHIGFTVLAASSASRSRQQSTLLATIIADKLSAAGWSWGFCTAVSLPIGAGLLMPIAEMVDVILSNLTSR